jgi:hypothetical protein
MAREESPNPYQKASCPGLYSAWEEGFQAYLAGEAVPDEHLKSPSEASNAWLNGYTAARLSGQQTAQARSQGPDGP